MRLAQVRGGGGRGQRVKAPDRGDWAMPQQHGRMSSPECHDREGDGIFRLKRARGRKGMEGQGQDGSRDTLRVEAFSHTVL
jgi:hypothetical protein